MLFSVLKPLSKWLRYSGASVIVSVNPLHWRWIPFFQRHVEGADGWPLGPNEITVTVSWLFLTIRVWIDNGDW